MALDGLDSGNDDDCAVASSQHHLSCVIAERKERRMFNIIYKPLSFIDGQKSSDWGLMDGECQSHSKSESS